MYIYISIYTSLSATSGPLSKVPSVPQSGCIPGQFERFLYISDFG